MSDLATRIVPDAAGLWPGFDLALEGGQLAEDDGLYTALILSLFTDAPAGDDAGLPRTERRGWWGDDAPAVAGDVFGSRLWLLERERDLPAVLQRAKAYAEEATAWLVADGVAAAVAVEVERLRAGVLGMTVAVSRPPNPVRRYQFELFWSRV